MEARLLALVVGAGPVGLTLAGCPGHPLAQQFSFTATSALIDISRGSTCIAPDDAELLVHLALRAVVTAEVLARRGAA